MKQLVFATHNGHKRDEISRLLDGGFSVKNLSDVGIHDDIPEIALTLEGNAQIKADYVHARTGLNVFADDTGLEVDALGGDPGVHSARYAGSDCDPAANMHKLLHALAGKSNRKARFRTVIWLILEGQPYHFVGEASGRIVEVKRGTGGFGYDPIFEPDLTDEIAAMFAHSPTFAELSPEQKNAISHRGKAMAQLIEFLKTYA